MKIIVIGGTGLIGSQLVARLKAGGHDVVAASPHTGVNVVTGEGLAAALAGAKVVVEFVGTWLDERDDDRAVAVDPSALYFGVELDDASLVAGPEARRMPTRFDAWLAQAMVKA
jgi:uncharacterized protein YbjT (DUF2867 family)